MSIVSNNIKYLRRLNGLTQEQFSRKIAIKRSLLGAYEEARANPNLTNLKNMAAAFGITVDNLLKNDLRKIRETPDMSLPLNTSRPMTVSHSGAIQAPPPRVATFAEPQPLSNIIEKYQQLKPAIRMVARQVTLKPVNGQASPATGQEPHDQQPQPWVQRATVAQQPVFQAQPLAAQQLPNQPQPVYQPQPKVQPQPAFQQQPAYNTYNPAQFPVFNNNYPVSPELNNGLRDDRSAQYPTIQWVASNQSNEYIAHYQNPAFLTQLPSFQLPNLPSGYYRAFESGADFVYPGALLVGAFVRNWYEIKDGERYVFVLRNLGFLFRTAYNHVKTNGVLVLGSDMPFIPDMEIPLHDIVEVWEIKACISTQLPAPQPSLERINQLMDEMQQELNQFRN